MTSDIIKINLDNFKRKSWDSEEYKNAVLVVDFVQKLMNDHDFDAIEQKYGNQPYLQHNRSMTDSIKGVLTVVKSFANRFPDYTYDVKHINVDGEYVTFHSHATINKKHRGNDTKGLNIIDTWKVVDGKIVEHWDAVQPLDLFMRFYNLLTGGAIRNKNGVF